MAACGRAPCCRRRWSRPQTLTLLFTLIMTGVVCILMGCGIPTTANYIIMVTIAAPALGLLGVEPIVAHFFVFYYGVLADITPPVALAAYAAAGMAGADPFRTGNTAFRLGLGKVLVPFVFVFSPSLLLVAGLHLAGFLHRLRRLRRRHHLPGRRLVRLAADADAVGTGAAGRRRDPAGGAGALFIAARRGADRAGAGPAGAGNTPRSRRARACLNAGQSHIRSPQPSPRRRDGLVGGLADEASAASAERW